MNPNAHANDHKKTQDLNLILLHRSKLPSFFYFQRNQRLLAIEMINQTCDSGGIRYSILLLSTPACFPSF